MTDTEQRERLTALLDPNTPTPDRPRPDKAHVKGMRHKLVDTVEPQSQITGEFVARVSDYQEDRQHEKFARHAFDGAIRKLARERRAVPVLYGHDTQSTEAIIGHVPPDGWEANADGLFARGQIDVGEPVGQRIYKMLKKGALAWSVGFTMKRVTPARNGSPGVLEEVKEMYELSVVPVPANNRTATLSLKSDEPREVSHTQLHDRLVEEGILARDADMQEVFDRARQDFFNALTGQNGASCPIHGGPGKSAPAARAQVRVVTFTTS